MRKLILVFLFLFFSAALALDDFQSVGIAKYAVLEAICDNIPLRAKDNENAKRITHVNKNTVLYATAQNKNYYKIELDENNYAYINKKYVELQAIIPEKRLESVDSVDVKDKKDRIEVEISTKTNSPFVFVDNGKTLEFKLFDAYYNPLNTKNKENKIIFPQIMENKLSFSYSTPKPLFGYDADKVDGGYIVKIKKAPKINPKKPLKNMVITLDAGHGGVEEGVCANGLKEKDINLQITKKLKKELKRSGAKVYLTRKKDVKVDLYQRTAFAKENKSDILLSIHQNSLPNWKDIDKKYGVGTYYYQSQSKGLANEILNQMVEDTGFRNDGLNYASFVLTRPSAQLSVLIECGYLIKPDEAKKLSNKKFQKLIAKSITKACKNYLKKTYLPL